MQETKEWSGESESSDSNKKKEAGMRERGEEWRNEIRSLSTA